MDLLYNKYKKATSPINSNNIQQTQTSEYVEHSVPVKNTGRRQYKNCLMEYD